MGRTHGRRIAEGIDLAIARGVPFVAQIASGGARTQEGYEALYQMGQTISAMNRARAAGIPSISWLCHPTMGGVHASYAAAADLILAEHGAAVGFAGPRVVSALTGEHVDETSHTADVYAAAGLIDALAPDRASAQHMVAEWVWAVHPQQWEPNTVAPPTESTVALTGWEAVQRARAPRASARQILHALSPRFVELRGDRAGHDDRCMLAAIARVDDQRVLVIGTDRHSPGAAGRRGSPTASGYRKAVRAIRIASRWRIPIVTLIDTAGADPTPASDRAGLTAAIAETIATLQACDVPTLGIVTGEGGSGGAYALATTDRLLMQDDAVFEVIAPEGAASILLRDPAQAPQVSELMGLGAAELRARGHSHGTLPGPTTHGEKAAHDSLRRAIAHHLFHRPRREEKR
ncbi:hypothetical protein IT882_06185 [Microbacterium schleiferi]|uniref:acetyl-CoA carboxytransferase n=1 Tax=Microbacterium schleiferi TaxID=69362 RepID=A0A7S8MZ53_9MICO|nr:carboxyl transferase domain-containing protein [Microbacterium schleiferi]QPE05588.1 hypothetical protein IT882_06185 [Microbacterium schleiferi]